MQLRRAASRKREVRPSGNVGNVANVASPPVPPSAGTGGRAAKTEALISRYSGGFCFDFRGQDGSLYLAGTSLLLKDHVDAVQGLLSIS